MEQKIRDAKRNKAKEKAKFLQQNRDKKLRKHNGVKNDRNGQRNAIKGQ